MLLSNHYEHFAATAQYSNIFMLNFLANSMFFQSDVDKYHNDDTESESCLEANSSHNEVEMITNKKRTRIVFSIFQMDQLENTFSMCQYPDPLNLSSFKKSGHSIEEYLGMNCKLL